MSQAKFLLDESNKPLVDKIIRFEKLKDGFEEVARKLRFKTTDLPHINTSKSQVKIDYREAYCEESKQIIADMYADDIELFNYSFG